MRDQGATGFGNAVRRSVLCSISVTAVIAAALVVPRLGWTAGLGTLAAGVLVLVVILLAMAPDGDEVGEGAPDTTP